MIVAISPRSFRITPGRHQEFLDESPLEPRYPTQERHLTELEMVELVGGCEALIVGIDPVTEEVLEAGPLQVVAKYGSGLDNIDLEAAERRGTRVSASPGANARAVAELTIGLMIALARHVGFHDRSARSGTWERKVGVELGGRRLGVIGYGEVGRRVADLAEGFGMSVVAHDPYRGEARVELVALQDLLQRSDVVSLHVPLTAETKNMIDGSALERFKPGAFLVNTARAGLVDEEALAEALASGRLAGAAADDFVEYPAPDSALMQLDSFLASPHAGASTVEAVERTGIAALEIVLEGLGLEP